MHAGTMHAEQIPTTADELGRAPRWLYGLGQLPGDPVTQPEKMPTSPKRSKQAPYFFNQAARRSVVAI